MHSSLRLPLGITVLLSAIALPTAAQAQVAVSGYLDAGMYRDYDKTNRLGTIQRSNLAFSGVEDLGGGLKATFRLSTRFEMGTGAPEGQGSKPFWHDESTVGLQSSWGQVRVGRALSAMWSQEWKYDAFSNVNRIASTAWHMAHTFSPTDRASNNGDPEYGRMANGIFYDSPNWGGVSVHLSASPERTLAPGRDGRATSAAVNYDQGPVAGMLGYERNGSGDKDWFAGGKYRFGAAAILLSYNRSTAGDSSDKSRMVSVGGTYDIGATTLRASYGQQRVHLDASNGDVTNKMASLGAEYKLSKRTMLYTSLGHQRFAGQSSHTAFGAGMAHAF
jgi:predicted porin